MLALLSVAPLSLYEGDSYVHRLHAFTDVGPHSTGYVVVEFFAGWCGHCQSFAPVWKEAARHACAAAPGLQFGAVDCVADYLLCQEMRISSFPTLRIFGPGFPAQGLPLPNCEHGCEPSAQVIHAVLQTLSGAPSASTVLPQELLASSAPLLVERSAHHACSAAQSATAPPQLAARGGLRPGQAPPASEEVPVPMADLCSAVLYGMQRELLLQPLEPSSERRFAFDEWLRTLAALFPGARNRAALATLVHQTAQLPQLDARTWSSMLQQSQQSRGALLPQGAPAGGIAWAACRGWSDESRGYPCGLWLLFHTLLAQADDAAAPRALRAVRGYVRHFFGCDECRRHFVAMAASSDDPLEGAKGADGAVLWLWRAHNRVNARLNQSGAAAVQQLGLLKQQFPSAARCPGCRAASGRWRDAPLLRHLRAAYCAEARPGSPCAAQQGQGQGQGQGGGGARDGGARDGASRGAELVYDLEDLAPEASVSAALVAALVAAALSVLRCRRATADRCPPQPAMRPINEYRHHWDGDERCGSQGTTLPLLRPPAAS